MKTIIHLMLVVVLAAFPVLVHAGNDGDTTKTTGTVMIGAWGASTNDSPDLVSEYAPTSGGPILNLDLSSFSKTGSLLVSAHARHSNDIEGTVDFDLGRMVRSHTSFTKMLHRLGHDPMTDLTATDTVDKAVYHTDFNPGMKYGMHYSVLFNRTELQIPSLSALTLAFEVRDQHREGHRQTYALSHCDACHVNSMNHPLNERTTDGTLEAKVAWKTGFVRARYTSRTLREGYKNVTLTYDDAVHPSLRLPLFNDRVQYDSAQGPLPVDLWPNIDKDIARLDIHLSKVGPFIVNGTGVWSNTQNTYTGLRSAYSGYMVNAAGRLGKHWRLTWRGRAYTIDSQDVFVNTAEPVSIAGPTKGKTYRELYGFDPDFLRQSALNRDVLESVLDASYRLGGRAGVFRFEWKFNGTDRQHYHVTPIDTKTTTNILGLSWYAHPARGVTLRARYRHGDVDNPFMALDQQASTLVSPAYPNPFVSPQYFDFQRARIGDGTASPSSWDEARAQASYTWGRSMLSGSYNWWNGDNTGGTLTNWSRTNQSATLTLWTALTESWEWYVGYAWQDLSLDSPTTIPVYDG
ncbi:MAG: hypothetical protein GXP48_12720 [Acidobacteria bacterium]|nr:hypothetical protein [Acidobacteriota bacterium]